MANGHKPDVLSLENLTVYYDTERGPVHAVEDVTFSLHAQERFGLAGESGSGKSSMALTIMRLLKPPARIVSGSIWLENIDLLAVPESQMKALRLAQIALVAQGSMNSLNPVARVRQQITDGLADHGVKLTKSELDERVTSLLAKVGLSPQVANMFPHELSGGMKQRVVIAIAISLRPKVIIADELTSALDVVVQRQVMETLKDIQSEIGASVILVGHDMGLMAQFVAAAGGDVRRSPDGGLAGARDFQASPPPIHATAHFKPALDRNQGPLHRHSRPAAIAAQRAAGLRVPSPVSPGGGALPHGSAGAARAANRSLGLLPLRLLRRQR